MARTPCLIDIWFLLPSFLLKLLCNFSTSPELCSWLNLVGKYNDDGGAVDSLRGKKDYESLGILKINVLFQS